MKVSRRSFLKGSAATAASLTLTGGIAKTVLATTNATELTPSPLNKWPGRVVVNFNKNAVTNNSTIAADVVKKMVDDSIMKLTDKATVGEAWKAVFPATLTAQSKIAIKVCTANPYSPTTHWVSVRAITDGLQLMDINGAKLPPANISIYDGNADKLATANYNATNFPGITIKGWTSTSMLDGGDGAISNRAYAGTLKDADFLINCFSPRGHNLAFAEGVTLGFKSHYGTYALAKPVDLHNENAPNVASDYLRDMTCVGPVFKKLVLSLCSGIIGLKEGNGPGFSDSKDSYVNYIKTVDPNATTQVPSTIILSTDPVSCEMQTLKMMRLNNPAGGKLKTTYAIADMPQYLKGAAGIAGTTGDKKAYNIGILDETKMDVRRIINGASTTSIANHFPAHNSANITSIVASPISGHQSTFIEYKLPAQLIGQSVDIRIFALSGGLVYKTTQKVSGAISHFSWDHTNRAGNRVNVGKFIVKLSTNELELSTHFSII
jgi:hypothetical protein